MNSIQRQPFPVTEALSNQHNNTITAVNFHRTNLSTSSHAEQDVVSDEISHSYYRTTSSPTDSVVFQVSELYIGINFSPENLKAPSTLMNGSSA